MEHKANGWIILDKSLLTHEELEYLDGIRLRLLIAKLEGSINVTTKVGRGMKDLERALPQYYEKGGKFITEDEMKLYEKIDKEMHLEEIKICPICKGTGGTNDGFACYLCNPDKFREQTI